MNKKFQLVMFLLVMLLGSVGEMFAQSTTAAISGTVVDERQSVIPSATVTARNVETGITRTAQTDGDGRYNFRTFSKVRIELKFRA